MNERVPEEQRYEVKFVVSELLREQVGHWLRIQRGGFRTAYPPRQVNNIYFDTFGYDAYWENLVGASARTKVRYRWYGESLEPASGALELKCKRNLYGWKRIYEIDSSPYAHGAHWRHVRESIERQLPEEARKWMEAHPQTVLVNSYRRAYFVSSDGRVRATLDWNQVVWDQRFNSYPNFTRPANMPKSVVLEIKCARRDRELASQALQGLPTRVSRHSKYVVGVRAISGG